ncbi:hypothetical protein WK39_16995 [Burkholderia cepacia]|nr:hypothetical protein WK40_32965 [Burkholderia cepacia]KVS58981.1 hypothetical protein WK39_16995 [Burkholderia cepacia]
MRIFEPRVDSARTRVRSRFCDNNGIKGALYFDILMADRNDGSEISISLEFDYLSAFFSVVGD